MIIRGNAATCAAINWSKLELWETAPQLVLPSTMRFKLVNTTDYYSCTSGGGGYDFF